MAAESRKDNRFSVSTATTAIGTDGSFDDDDDESEKIQDTDDDENEVAVNVRQSEADSRWHKGGSKTVKKSLILMRSSLASTSKRGLESSSSSTKIKDQNITLMGPVEDVRKQTAGRQIKRSIPRKQGAEEQMQLEASLSSWSVGEKAKLLAGIRRYGADNHSVISRLMGTRTAQEVEAFIEMLRKNEPRPPPKKRKGFKKSPIEAWTELVSEMTYNEPYDYSQDIGKVFRLIARHEEFETSPIPRLRWRKIYQFLADLLEDKAHIQELSDVESHIVIDMMHKLGDTLHSVDSSVQHSLMAGKFSMLNTDQPDRAARARLYIQALSNDFDYQFEEPEQPSEDNPAAGPSQPTPPSQPSMPPSRPGPSSPSVKTSASSHSIKRSSSSISVKATASSSGLLNSPHPCPPSSSNGDARDSPNPSGSQKKETPEPTPFFKPPLFTLNPLCIPPKLLTLKHPVEYL